jgi:uncharacterized membrane protein YdbT with pleckstrin-like domain
MLAPDEQLLLHTHPHWKMLAGPAMVFVLGTALAGFGAGEIYRYVASGPSREIALLVVAVVWLLLVLWQCLGRFLEWKSTHFVITDRRVMVRQGVMTHTGRDIPLTRISSVQFRNGLWDRMLGTGTLIIDSSSHEPLEYDDIPQVERVHSLLYHEVFDASGPGSRGPAPYDYRASYQDDRYREN